MTSSNNSNISGKSTDKTIEKKIRAEGMKWLCESYLEMTRDNIHQRSYMRISDDDILFLNGKSKLPDKDKKSLDLTINDIDLASALMSIPLLYVGGTGSGKTFMVEARNEILFGKDGYYTLRLSGGSFGNSVLEPYVEIKRVEGIPKMFIDQEACKKYFALFIDEPNRAESQEILQILDKKIHLNSEFGYLRVPIDGTTRFKNLAITSAMNPADAIHTSAEELDIAVENRMIRIKFPNIISESASNLFSAKPKSTYNFHDEFLEIFYAKSGLDKSRFSWDYLYSKITDPDLFRVQYDGKISEFIDSVFSYVSQDPNERTLENDVKKIFDENIAIFRAVYSGQEFIPKFKINDNDNSYMVVTQTIRKLKHGLEARDTDKIYDMSRIFSFVRGMKTKRYDFNVTFNDVCAALGIVLESKTITGSSDGNLMSLVNDARLAYKNIHTKMNIKESEFEDRHFGVRQAIWQAAIYAGSDTEGNGFDVYSKTLDKNIMTLNSTLNQNEVSQMVLRSRILADISILKAYSEEHKSEISDILKSENPFYLFRKVYDETRYEHDIFDRLYSTIKL